MTLLDSNQYDLIGLVETHALAIPVDIHAHFRKCNYICL
jgi:hypothetical protein